MSWDCPLEFKKPLYSIKDDEPEIFIYEYQKFKMPLVKFNQLEHKDNLKFIQFIKDYKFYINSFFNDIIVNLSKENINYDIHKLKILKIDLEDILYDLYLKNSS